MPVDLGRERAPFAKYSFFAHRYSMFNIYCRSALVFHPKTVRIDVDGVNIYNILMAKYVFTLFGGMRMKKRGIVGLGIAVALLLAIAYVFTFGLPLGIREVQPIVGQVKALKLGPDLAGGFYAVYAAKAEGDGDYAQAVQDTADIILARLEAKGIDGADIAMQGKSDLSVVIPGYADDPAALSDYLRAPAALEWRDGDGNAILTSADVASASAVFEDEAYALKLTLTTDGGKKFTEATTRLVGGEVEVYLDGALIERAHVDAPNTTGTAIVAGGFSKARADELVMQIDSGVIPLRLNERQAQYTDAAAGGQAITKGLWAGAAITVFAVALMVLVYRLLGLMAGISLCFHALLMLFCILTMPGVLLTGPGIVAAVLSIAMAANAHIVVFERIREELKNGKPAESAVSLGYGRALKPLMDTGVVALIAAAALAVFGAPALKGFGFALAIGVGVSAFDVLVITRLLLKNVIRLGIENNKPLAGV
jgi:protein-export SecD/SecF family membrane protein